MGYGDRKVRCMVTGFDDRGREERCMVMRLDDGGREVWGMVIEKYVVW